MASWKKDHLTLVNRNAYDKGTIWTGISQQVRPPMAVASAVPQIAQRLGSCRYLGHWI